MILLAPFETIVNIVATHRASRCLCACETLGWHEKAQHIRAPVLIMHGLDDLTVPFQHGVALFRALGAAGVNAKLLVVPDKNHNDVVAVQVTMPTMPTPNPYFAHALSTP